MTPINSKTVIIIFIIFIITIYAKSKKDLSLENCFKCKEILNNVKILSPDETLDELIFKNKSIARFAHVEFDIIWNIDKKEFQNSNKEIREKLIEILNSNEENLLIGIRNEINNKFRKLLRKGARRFWNKWVKKSKYKLTTLIDTNKVYGSGTIS
eukprot:jgi/Orpsp1_1/1192907/evm.model.d7180000096841.1